MHVRLQGQCHRLSERGYHAAQYRGLQPGWIWTFGPCGRSRRLRQHVRSTSRHEAARLNFKEPIGPQRSRALPHYLKSVGFQRQHYHLDQVSASPVSARDRIVYFEISGPAGSWRCLMKAPRDRLATINSWWIGTRLRLPAAVRIACRSDTVLATPPHPGEDGTGRGAEEAPASITAAPGAG